MPCLFCTIVDGSTAADVVLADDVAVAFLDTSPVFEGHVLVVPRVHHVVLGDLAVDVIGPFFERVQRVAGAVERALGSGGSWVSMNNRVSQSVAHLHVHVVPRTKGDGLRGFYWPRRRYPDAAAAWAIAERIRGEL